MHFLGINPVIIPFHYNPGLCRVSSRQPKRSRFSISLEVGEALRPELLAALKSHLTRHSGFGTPRRIAEKIPRVAKWGSGNCQAKPSNEQQHYIMKYYEYRRYKNNIKIQRPVFDCRIIKTFIGS